MATLITYSPGTPIKSSDMNSNLNALNGGANSVQQSGETPPNRLVYAQPSGYASPSQDMEDDGTLHTRGKHNSTLLNFISAVPGGAGAAVVGFGDSTTASEFCTFWGLVQVNRNGTKQANGLYSGGTTPSGTLRTGDIWIQG